MDYLLSEKLRFLVREKRLELSGVSPRGPKISLHLVQAEPSSTDYISGSAKLSNEDSKSRRG
jgi:hypothetical protein